MDSGDPVKRSKRSRIGRNDPCTCGSGKKYKRCHGSVSSPPRIPEDQLREMFRTVEAQRVQRERQQGLGRQIISAEVDGTRFVATKHRIYHSRNWKTFHDFLTQYLANVLGA